MAHARSPSPSSEKILVVFDFDSTLVEASCNQSYILKLLPEVSKESKGPGIMWEMPPGNQQQSVLPSELIDCMNDIHFVSGMRELLLDLQRNGHETIIISDNNSVFIGHTLKVAGLQHCIASVFTNPSWFDEKGSLKMAEFHHQDWCELCPPNLCKGHVLRNYLRQRRSEGEEFLFVAYVGDGMNDFCPALCLNENDMVLPRQNFELHHILDMEDFNEEQNRFKVKCKIVPWHSGAVIKQALFQRLNSNAVEYFPFI